MPNGFFPVEGGAISLAGDADDIYGAPPTDGVHSLNDPGVATLGDEWVVDVAVATNFAGGQYNFRQDTFTGSHGWKLTEVYSNADRSVQFAVFSTFESGQQFLAGHTMYTGNILYDVNRFTFQTNLPGDSANRSFLIATQGFADLHVLEPDYVVPNGFFFIGFGSIALTGLPNFTRPLYRRLPNDGINALWMGPSVNRVPRLVDMAGQLVDKAVATNFAGEQYTFGRPTIPTPRPPRCVPGICN